MRKQLIFLLAGALLASACQLQLTDVASTAKKTSATPPKKDAKSPSPSSAPDESPRPVNSASPIASTPPVSSTPNVPAEATTLLKGLVKLDPSYVIAVGGGNFVSTNGGTVIATGGGNVISVGGGNVIAVGGGNVISTGGGNVIATGGGNVIATGGGNYQLLQAEEDTTRKAIQGMGVVAVSLTTGKPLGQAVFTDAEGRYSITVPESIKENVLVVAAFPGKSADDPIVKDQRLRLNVVVDPRTTSDTQVSDEASLTTTYIRDSFRSKFEFFFNPKAYETGEVSLLKSEFIPVAMRPMVDAVKKRMQDAKIAAGVPDEKVGPMARHHADMMLSHVKLDSITMNKDALVGADPALIGQPVVPVLTDIARDMQNAIGYRLYTEKKSIAEITQKWDIAGANAARAKAGLPPYEFKTPSDLGGFLIEWYCGKDDPTFEKLKPIWASLGLQEKKRLALDACAVSIGIRMGYAMLLNEKNGADANSQGIQDRVIADIANYGPGATP